jgi:hypothetical protein
MCWWCVDVKKTWFFDEVKNRTKTAILSLFFETLKNGYFWPFFVCWRVLMISWCVDNKYWRWTMLTTRWWWRWWRKKVVRETKNDEKWLSVKPEKKTPNGARYGRRETAERKSHKERLWRDRVSKTCPTSIIKKTTATKSREWHVECERSDVRGVLRNMRSILTWVIYPTRGTHESRRVRAQRSACRYRKKSVRIFLIRSFMTARRLGNRHTRP